MSDALQLLAVPFLIALVLTGIHTYLGLHVLARNIIFVDLALAQISALGATVAFMLGHLPGSTAAYSYSLVFTIMGAVILSFSRSWTGRISQETFIGVVYVVSAAAAFLLVDQAPAGAEHIKQILVGSILTTTAVDLFKVAGLYSAVGLFHWCVRQRFIQISFQPEQAAQTNVRLWLWDFLFYISFGVVVTSSVSIAGVLLVFCFLIIPAAIGTLYSTSILTKLLIGWTMGTLASLIGLGASYVWDLPTGATIVCVFGATLALAAILQPLLLTPTEQRRLVIAKALSGLRTGSLSILFLSGCWLTVNPHADQPLLNLVETYQPAVRAFLSAEEQRLLDQAIYGEDRMRSQINHLDTMEQDSRWQGEALTADSLRRVTGYTLTFQEMAQGEHFVQQTMRYKVRDRQRWAIGLPLALFALGCLLLQPAASKDSPTL